MTDRASRLVVAVVDDDRRILESLGSLLESADYAVRLFGSGALLLASDCLAEIDCLISDIGMPGMDGLELLRSVHGTRPELPVILITGRPDLPNPSSPIGSGHYRLFRKPYNGEELLAAIRDAVRNSPLSRPGT